MRIAIRGTSFAARAITAGLIHEGYAVSADSPGYTVQIDDDRTAIHIVVDGIPGPLESALVNAIAELAPGGRVVLQREGGVQDEQTVRILCPTIDIFRQAVERGVLRGLMRLIPLPGPEPEPAPAPAPVPRPWYKRWPAPAVILALLLHAATASAQVVVPTGGGSGGSVTQGTSPWVVSFGSPPHIICDSGCGSPAVTLDGDAFTAGLTNVAVFAGVFDDSLALLSSGTQGTPRVTSARGLHVNLRDENGLAHGTSVNPVFVSHAFDATALGDGVTSAIVLVPTFGFGYVYNGTTWDRARGDTTSGAWVNIKASTTLPVSGTFWQATQPVSLASVPSHAVTNAGTFAVQVTSAPTTAVTGTFWQATQPVSGTVTTTPPANASTNIAQMNGVTVAMNTGTRSTGTQRVTIATDDVVPVTGTFWQTTQPVSGTVTANAGTGTLAVSLATAPTTTVVQPTGSNLHIQCDAGCGGAAAFADNAAFTFGTTSIGIAAAAVDDVGTRTVTENSAAALRMTPLSGLHVNLRNQAGTELGTAGNPVMIDDAAALAVTGAFFQATQPVSGTVTTTPPANASTNVAQLAGTATSVNSGVKDAGTLRVVLATDQPALTNKLLVTPDSVALPANQSVNVAQVAGTTTDVNSGVKSAGTIRVVLATDQPALTNKLLVTPDSVALPANQSVNVAQMAGVATSMNTGVRDTGTQRVTIATNDLVPVSLAAETTKVIGTVNVAAAQTIAVTQATAANLNATVTPIALTKGTQGATGFSTQDLKDSGRTNLNFYLVAGASGATGVETLMTLTRAPGTGATVAATTYTVTSGKTLRITSLSVATRGNAIATIQSTTFNVRINTAGACIVSSTPIAMSARSATAAVASAWDRVIIPINDGWEIAGNGTVAFCVSTNATFVTNAPTLDVTMTGFEY